MESVQFQLETAQAQRQLREMKRIRCFEEKVAELYSLGKIRGFLHLYIGEETDAVGAMQAFTPDDAIVSTYREHGHALARGLSMDSLMAELYGKAHGCSKAHGGSILSDGLRPFMRLVRSGSLSAWFTKTEKVCL